jgi:hypothetical protein
VDVSRSLRRVHHDEEHAGYRSTLSLPGHQVEQIIVLAEQPRLSLDVGYVVPA